MKVFVSQPMAGKTDEEIVEGRRKAYAYMRERYGKDITLIDSYFPGYSVMNPCYCLGEAIKKLAQCDIVVFLPGWDKARGCLIEHECAKQYSIAYILMED